MRTAILSLLALGAGLVPTAHAETIDVAFALDGSGTQSLSDDTLTVTLEAVEAGGVTFDAVLTVVGSSTLNQLSSGLGVVGGSNPVNDGESLTFSLVLQDIVGGAIAFDGFTGVDFSFFGGEGEQAVFSTDAALSTAGDNFFTAEGTDDDPADLGAYLPVVFTLFGNDAGGTVSFRVDSVGARFHTPDPVPEPSSFFLLGSAGAILLARARRRRRQR